MTAIRKINDTRIRYDITCLWAPGGLVKGENEKNESITRKESKEGRKVAYLRYRFNAFLKGSFKEIKY